MIFALNSTEFYDSAKCEDLSSHMIRAYPFRYQSERCFEILEGLNFTAHIPSYWYNTCLKMLLKQDYSPELLDILLSKLKIWPSTN